MARYSQPVVRDPGANFTLADVELDEPRGWTKFWWRISPQVECHTGHGGGGCTGSLDLIQAGCAGSRGCGHRGEGRVRRAVTKGALGEGAAARVRWWRTCHLQITEE